MLLSILSSALTDLLPGIFNQLVSGRVRNIQIGSLAFTPISHRVLTA